MTKTLDDIRLADFVLEQPKKTSTFVERQFPSIYREDGRELVELVKSYYKFLEEHDEQSVYNIRRIYEYRNIDTTLERMLIFFKNKFLNGLFFDQDIRFIVKNILDLYRRKGSKEGIELFFKLFFDSEVSIYFPSQDMFKPSTSQWKAGSFIQLYSTTDFNRFDGIVNKRIFGDKSNASAFVDDLFFVNINNAYVPIIFISDVKGQFAGFDEVYSSDPFIFYGRVYGSLRSIEIDQSNTNASGGNSVGDIVEITSQRGYGAKGRVTKISTELSGEISFTIDDGNYGYTTTNTDILISDQSAFFSETEGFQFIINERVKQAKNSNTEVFGTVIGRKSDSIGLYIDFSQLDDQIIELDTTGSEYNLGEEVTQVNTFGIEVFGTVVDQEEGSILVELDKSKPGVDTQRYFFEKGRPLSTTERITNLVKPVLNVFDDYFFEDGSLITTVSRELNIELLPLFVTGKNTTARAEIGSIKNTETITIVTDIIENYLNVPLNANNYSEVPPALLEMSGTRVDSNTAPSLDTPLNEAFVPETFVIGEIETLSNINPGFDHVSDVFVAARENLLRRFNLQDQILTVSVPPGVVLFRGDSINQTKQVLTFEGETISTVVKGTIVAVSGNDITVKQRTFESFVVEEPIFKEGSNIAITVNARNRDFNSSPLGLNAAIVGDVETVLGKIQEVEIFDSGVGYEDESIVTLTQLQSESPFGDAIGIANARGQGITEGKWKTFESHPNQEKVIQDSFFYQDYSYELTTDINPILYEAEYRSQMHPTGLKLFTKFGATAVINNEINVFSSIAQFDEIISEPSDSSFIAGNGFQYLNIQ